MTETSVNILLIEDEPQIRRFVRSALEEQGWKVIRVWEHEAPEASGKRIEALARQVGLHARPAD